MSVPAFPPLAPGRGAASAFWSAARERRLVIQRCAACATWVWYPATRCRACHSDALAWTELDGRGTVYTFTEVHRSFLPDATRGEPYIVVIVELEGAPGVRFVSNLIDVAGDDVQVGMPVELAWVETEHACFPVFRIASRP